MKILRHFPILLLSMLISCLPAACGEVGQEEDGPNDFQPIVLTKSQQEVAARGNDFAVALFKAGYQAGKGENLFLSPMSVSMLCCMLANGAEGETYTEIVNTLGLKGFTIDQVNDYYETMVDALLKADNTVSFSLANSIWAAKDLSVKKSFKNAMNDIYDADTYSVDFSAPSTLKQINGWCSTKTSGLVPKMFEELSAQTRMMLINALYFKGSWVTQFPKDQTAKDDFTTLSGAKAKTEFMQLTADLAGYQDESVSLVRMPYGNGAFLMEAIVPAGDFSTFVAGLDREKLAKWEVPTHSRVDLRFPKFKAEYDTDEQLIPMMESLGMKRAFSSFVAEFGKMSDEPLYVSKMRQKTCVIVNEEGTEAAAVTVADMRKNGAGPATAVMRFDRPFLYLIRESSTGAILFIGAKVK